jgi:hypothetical protein
MHGKLYTNLNEPNEPNLTEPKQRFAPLTITWDVLKFSYLTRSIHTDNRKVIEGNGLLWEIFWSPINWKTILQILKTFITTWRLVDIQEFHRKNATDQNTSWQCAERDPILFEIHKYQVPLG